MANDCSRVRTFTSVDHVDQAAQRPHLIAVSGGPCRRRLLLPFVNPIETSKLYQLGWLVRVYTRLIRPRGGGHYQDVRGASLSDGSNVGGERDSMGENAYRDCRA
jgi:hypothetical protein